MSIGEYPKHDRYGRYLLPDPDTGHERAYTRVTTLGKTISDLFGLMRWQNRMTAKGIAVRPDLYALAAATPVDDKKAMDKLTDDAKEAAAASSGANTGTAVHAFSEAFDRGQRPEVPKEWKPDIEAYRQATSHLHMDSDHIECILLNREFDVAGTADRILTVPGAGRVVADVKTGKTLDWGWGEIAVQLALYAGAEFALDRLTGRWEPMPEVNREWGLVIHLPAGQGRCDLYRMDLLAGHHGAELCRDVRAWRKRNGLSRPYVAVETRGDDPSTDADTGDGHREPDPPYGERIAAATTVAELENLWREARKRGLWTTALTRQARERKAALSR